MPSFEPGTRVHARPKGKNYWRVANVVEPDPNPKPNHITVVFVGRLEKVQVSSNNVKLPPDQTPSAPAVDLTNDPAPQNNNSTSLPAYSDPWDPNSVNLPVPSPSDSPEPNSDAPSPSPERSPPSASVLNSRQPTRQWLLSNSDTRRQGKSGKPQVIDDPSHTNHPNHEFAPWQVAHAHPSTETPSYPYPSDHDQSFDSEYPPSSPPGFQFTPIRQSFTNSHARPHPPSNGPLHRSSASLRPPHQLPNTTSWSSVTSPPHHPTAYPTRLVSFPGYTHPQKRKGLTIREHERHPLRSVDEHLPIPRTAPSRNDFQAVPRHPQSSFDDDVPIPRNAARTRFSSDAYNASSDHPRNFYPAQKRQRTDSLRYDLIANDQMPPPSGMESAICNLSRRLAKRELSRCSNHWEGRRNEMGMRSLPYQRLLMRADNRVIIAPGFSLAESRQQEPSGTASDSDATILEEVLTSLSLESAESCLESGVEQPRSALRKPKLAVRSGGRKKSRPKKLRPPSSERRPLQLGDSSPSEITAKVLDLPDYSGQHSGSPKPKVFACSCAEDRKQSLKYNDTIQCCTCSLWLHGACAGLEPEDLRQFRAASSMEDKKFICVQCLDDQVSPIPVRTPPQHNLSSEKAMWFSSIPRITNAIRRTGTISTDSWLLFNLENESYRSIRHWLREPLAEDEISARGDNLEQLRAGVANISVGIRERTIIDAIFVKASTAHVI